MPFFNGDGIFALRKSREADSLLDSVRLSATSTIVEPGLEPVLPQIAGVLEKDIENSTLETSATIYVEFRNDDPRNPTNFSNCMKWVITITACFMTGISSSTAASYNLGFSSMARDLNCTDFQATIGLSLYAIGFGIVPLVTASFSEEFGRRPLYIGSLIGLILSDLMVALAQNVQTVIIGRFLAGSFGSTGATMVGGTVADIWAPEERGLPMALFTLSAIGCTGLGPVFAGWVDMNKSMEWRWIQWIQIIIAGGYLIVAPFLLKETRATVLLTRIAKRIRKETGDSRYRARVEDERPTLRTMIYASCTRPILFLLTEPTVLSVSTWIGFAWGVFYCLLESMAPIFKRLHNFNTGETGTVFFTMTLGALLGFATNIIQERLYRANFKKRGPEARLYMACFAAFLFPIGMFIFAWSSFPKVHWIVPCIGVTIFCWGVFLIYLAVFTYLADCYGIYASSSLAGQSLFRNAFGMAFPLFTKQMLDVLTVKWANTMFALMAVAMIPIPFILFYYGPAIRARSKFSIQPVVDLEKPLS